MTMLQRHMPVTFFGHAFHFNAFLTIFDHPHSYNIYVNSFCSTSQVHFSNGCIINENTQHISVDRRPKLIEM